MKKWRKRKFKIGRTTYDMEMVHSDNPKLEGGYGLTNHWSQECFMRSDAHYDQRMDTLMHEVLHILVDHSGARRMLTYDQEEMLVASLAPALLDAFDANPWLIEIFEKEPR